MFDHLFDTLEDRSRWIVAYSEYLRHFCEYLTLQEAIDLAEKTLEEDESNQKIRFSTEDVEKLGFDNLKALEEKSGFKFPNAMKFVIMKQQYVVFGFKYMYNDPTQIIVDNLTTTYDDQVLVHFMYGHHSLGEFIRFEDVIGVGDHENGDTEIKGWKGKYRIFNKELLEKIQSGCLDE